MSYTDGRLEALQVREMFDRIARVYDRMNRLMTVGLDRRWRRIAAKSAVRPGDRVLDAACGTGDLALAALRAGAGSVTGLDFSTRMLDEARRKSREIEWVEGDLLSLPFSDASFNAATIGFGIRNVSDLGQALRELRRALVPGGRLAILEITDPRGRLGLFHRAWLGKLVPLAGRVIPGGRAYVYLPASVERFVAPRELARELAEAGFAEIRYRFLGGGVVALHVGVAR